MTPAFACPSGEQKAYDPCVVDDTPLDWVDRLMEGVDDLPPPCFSAPEILENARLAVENDPIVRWGSREERRHYDELYKAIVLAQDVQTCEGLLRGEDVPKSRLDPEWAKAYGMP